MDDTACAACGAETLLFECPHCGEGYCADHELPHHACGGLASGDDEEPDELAAAGFEPLSGTETSDEPEPAAEAPDDRTDPIATDGPGGTAAVPFGADERDAAREARPDTERRWPVPEVRGLPHERGEDLESWFRRQSLVGYTLKVGILSLLFNAAYYTGLAAAMYGYL